MNQLGDALLSEDRPFSWAEVGLELTLVNGVTGDPSLYAFFPQTGEAVLFDLGRIDQLSHKLLLKARLICVSHTHFDHFIGFDRLLRVNIPHGRILEFCGPAGLAENIRSKILGYTWNLLDPDQLRFVIHEVDAIGGRQSFAIHNTDGFKIRPIAPPELNDASGSMPSPIAPAAYMTKLADGSRIEAVALDHGIPSIAFVIQSPLRFSVRVDELHRLGLNPGPWIRQLQMAAADLRYDDEIDCDGSSYRVGDLAAQLLSYSAPKSLAYVTDIAYSDDNLNRLESAMQGVDLLVCEASFLKEDEDKARSKKHLTTEQACLIAKRIKAKSLKLFHHSKIYARDTSLHDLERERYWGDEDLPVL